MASKKSTCDRVRRGIAGKTREEIMDAIRVEFYLPRPKAQLEQSGRTAKSKSAKAPRKARS